MASLAEDATATLRTAMEAIGHRDAELSKTRAEAAARARQARPPSPPPLPSTHIPSAFSVTTALSTLWRLSEWERRPWRTQRWSDDLCPHMSARDVD